MKNQKGQSLIEMIVAISIFILVVSVVIYLILDVYLADRAGREKTIAVFLAKEGIEAISSIRDNNWSDLTNGQHGLVISGNNWVFQGTQDDVSDQLNQGIREINIEQIDNRRKKITAQVTWKLTENRSQTVSMVTYLTNWTEPMLSYVAQLHYRWRSDDGGE